MRRSLYPCLLFLLSAPVMAQGPVRALTLDRVVQMAQQQSPDAEAARHTFRSAYWNYRYYRANYLPSLSLSADPSLNRSINKITQNDGSLRFLEQNVLSSDLTMSLTQNIPWTGGYVFLESSLQRIDQLNDHSFSWQSSPVNFGIRQSLFGYNSLKWDRRIEPVRYTEAKKNYVETLELVAERAVSKFFDLAMAQSNYEMACFNYANADTLAAFGRGRYEIGRIPESEMLQLELNKLTEEANRMKAQIEMDNCVQELRSYLNIQEETELRVEVNDSLPGFTVSLPEALLQANQNSPDIQNMIRRKLEARSSVAQAKSNAGLKADLYMRFGLTQTANRLDKAYKNPLDQQYISMGVSLPILDWGRGKGRVRVARSNQDLVDTQVEQSRLDFDMNVRKLVNQFNLQQQRVRIAARADEMARRRNDVARGLYLLGKSTILDLNASISERDNARSNYISSLYTYWSLYYTLRSVTLFDFEKRIPLEADYDRLLENIAK